MSQDSPNDEWLSISEAARRLGLHRNTLARWTDAGRIKAFVLPGRGDRRYLASTLEAFLAANSSSASAGSEDESGDHSLTLLKNRNSA